MIENSAKTNLKIAADVLLWCTIFGFAGLILWFGMILLGLMDFAYSIHSNFGTFSRQQFDVMIYMTLIIWKMMVVLFFLIPYISILIVLRYTKA